MTRIVATSDLHGHLPKIPPCDLLILGGDLSIGGSPLLQAKWLDEEFRDWLNSIETKAIVGVAGNHDYIFEKHDHLIPEGLPWHYLQDNAVEVCGLKIYGSPWQLPFWGAFNMCEKDLARQYQNIPTGLDILISHAPPFGILDQVPNFLHESEDMADTPLHTGSLSLRDKILEVRPKLCIFGHIHNSHGLIKRDGITYANVSLLNDDLEIIHSPVTFDL